jgi:hypothetical protein
MTVYWRPGARVSGVSAAVALPELQKIADEHDNELRPPDVLEAARPRTAPLHPAFEWNNMAAAEQYRLYQARHIVRSVRIVDADHGDRPAYIYVPPATHGEQGAYRSPEVLVQHEAEWARAVRQLNQSIASAKRALDDLERIARENDGEHRIADVTVAVAALEVAREAIAALHAA